MNPLPWHSAKQVHYPGGYRDGYVSIRDRDNNQVGLIFVGEGTEAQCVAVAAMICGLVNEHMTPLACQLRASVEKVRNGVGT